MSSAATTIDAPTTEVADQRVATMRLLMMIVCIAAGLIIGYQFLGPTSSAQPTTRAEPLMPSLPPVPQSETPLVSPSILLTPEEVVATQMEALADYPHNRSAIRQVFAFASPANRAVTGPIARFEQLILRKTYSPMVKSDHWMAGRAVSRYGQATVLVTTIDEDQQVSLFRFYLSKQSEPYAGCWMTDRVIRLFEGQDSPPEIEPRPKST